MAVAVIAVLLAGSAVARAESISVFLTHQTTSGGEIGVQVDLADAVEGGVQFTAQVRKIPGVALGDGDILAVWMDVNPAVALAAVEPTTPYVPADLDVTGFVKGHDAIGSKPFGKNGPNIEGMQGEFSATTSPYDMAIRFGSNGAGQNFYPTVSLRLTNITLADFLTSRFAARVTSIGATGDSGKYAGRAPETIVPTPSAVGGGGACLAGLALLRRRLAA